MIETGDENIESDENNCLVHKDCQNRKYIAIVVSSQPKVDQIRLKCFANKFRINVLIIDDEI